MNAPALVTVTALRKAHSSTRAFVVSEGGFRGEFLTGGLDLDLCFGGCMGKG